MVEGGSPCIRHSLIRTSCARQPGRPAPAGGATPPSRRGTTPSPAAAETRQPGAVMADDACRARGRADRSVGRASRGRWRTQRRAASSSGVPGVGGARGRERAGPTRSHPEPGRDPAQRRRVLWGRPHGRRGRRGHPPPSTERGRSRAVDESAIARANTRRGVEQRQLVGLITQRSGVRIPPPLPVSKRDRAIIARSRFVVLDRDPDGAGTLPKQTELLHGLLAARRDHVGAYGDRREERLELRRALEEVAEPLGDITQPPQ